jgi:PAS domain S-box-containing protein
VSSVGPGDSTASPETGRRDWLDLLTVAGDGLVHAADTERVLATIDAIAVPALADLGVVDLLDGPSLRPARAMGADPAAARALEALHREAPTPAPADPRAAVLRTRQALVASDLAASEDAYEGALARLGAGSAMFLPLVARDRAFGVLTLATRGHERRYGEPDLALGEALARYAALALDGARLDAERLDAVEDRRERDTTLRLVFRQLPGTVWAVDRELRFTYATGRLVNAAGVNPRDAIGARIGEFLERLDPADPWIVHHARALLGEEQSFEYLYRGRWYTVLIDALRASDGAIVGCVGAAFDVTDRRAEAQQLTLSESRLAEAQRTAHVGSFEWDVAANTVTWTDELHRIYGVGIGTFGGTLEAFLAFVHPDELARTGTIIEEALRRTGPFSYDHRVVRADGRVATLHTRGEVIVAPDGKALRMVGTCWDITALAEATRGRERTLSLLEATIEATADGVLVVDRDRRVVIRNRRFLALWRVPRELEDCRDEAPLLAHMRAQVEAPDEFARLSEERTATAEAESIDVVRFLDGRVYERYSGPQRVGDAVVGRVWSFRDISERERLLRSALFLSDATRLLASLDVEPALDAVAHMAVPYLGDGCAIDVFGDGGPRRVIAISRDARAPISPEVHPTVLAGHSLVYEVGAISYLGVPLLMKDDLVGAITLCASPRRKYVPADLEIAEELARRAALALDNARLYHRAQEALRARDELLSIAAHEIRGPLTAIRLALQSMQGAKIRPGLYPKLFEVADREGRKLSQFVDELLDLGRIREGRLTFRFETVSLGEVVRDVARRLDRELVRSGSSLAIVADENIVGKWDRFRVEQVVSNLLTNAVKFGLGKPIAIRTGLRAGRAVLTVTDHGIGIERRTLGRLFQPFERAVSERHYGGLGLGLHIVRTIVGAMGGVVSVDSEPGRGSTFTVELPVT